jgi:hypothetical protein
MAMDKSPYQSMNPDPDETFESTTVVIQIDLNETFHLQLLRRNRECDFFSVYMG